MGSLKCDCGPQLDASLRRVAQDGGAVLYLRQEGRGIGLVEKLKAYNLQDQGLDTFEANEQLGHQRDARKFDVAAKFLEDLGWAEVRLMTNNPDKVNALRAEGIRVTEVVPIQFEPNEHNAAYLAAKVKEAEARLRPMQSSDITWRWRASIPCTGWRPRCPRRSPKRPATRPRGQSW